MKKLIVRLTKNWLPKLIALIIAIVVWFLINKQLTDTPKVYKNMLYEES